MTIMKAVRTRDYGSAEVLDVVDMPDPKMGAHEVLVRVRASSVNPVDWKVRRGDLRPISGLTPPRILGADFAGEIEDVGRKVEGYAIALERLGLARTSDVPDPFRRVLLQLRGGARQLAVSVSNTDGKLVLIAPPQATITERRRDTIRVIYGGERHMVEYPLIVSGISHGPTGTVIFLKRPQGEGRFGRVERRHPSLIQVAIMAVAEEEGERESAFGEIFNGLKASTVFKVDANPQRSFEEGEETFTFTARI